MSSLVANFHPLAIWAWWIGLVVMATRAQSMNLSLVIIGLNIIMAQAFARNHQALQTFRLVMFSAVMLVAVRIVFQNIFGLPMGNDVVLRLPEIHLPLWFSGIRAGGPVTSESLTFALHQGLVLATIITCFAAASATISAHSILKSLPLGLHNIAMLMVIAITFIPHVLDDISRIRQAQRFRGVHTRKLNSIARLIVIVVETALERSVTLASSLTARGYAFHSPSRGTSRLLVMIMGAAALMVAALALNWPQWAIAALGALAAASLLVVVMKTRAEIQRSRFSDNSWRPQDFLLMGITLALAAITPVQQTLQFTLSLASLALLLSRRKSLEPVDVTP